MQFSKKNVGLSSRKITKRFEKEGRVSRVHICFWNGCNKPGTMTYQIGASPKFEKYCRVHYLRRVRNNDNV